MNYSFDCSQLVAVRRATESLEPSEACRLLSEVWEGEVKHKEQIDPVKIKYVQLYSELPLEIFEFVDEEFLGEFEDWQDVNHVPQRIVQFEDCIRTLARYGYDVEIIFIINTPTESQNRVYQTTNEALLDALYSMSLYYTGEGAGCETLIINLKK